MEREKFSFLKYKQKVKLKMARRRSRASPKSAMPVWLIVTLVAVVGGLLAFGSGALSFEDGGVSVGTDDSTETTVAAASSFCVQNAQLDLDVRVKDALSTSASYLNGTAYLKNMDTGSIQEQTLTAGGTTAFTTLSGAIECTSEDGYMLYIKADGTLNSDGAVEIPSSLFTKKTVELSTIEVSNWAPFKSKGYDNVAKANIRVNGSDATASVNGTGYTEAQSEIFASSTISRDFLGDADSVLDVTFTIRPNATSQAYGEGLIIALDTEDSSNVNDWDEDLVEVYFNGVLLSEADLSANDVKALSASELIYEVTSETIGASLASGDLERDVESTLRLVMQTTSGNAADFDPVINIVAVGDYLSDEDDSVILENVGFRDDSSRTQLYSAQSITLSVSSS